MLNLFHNRCGHGNKRMLIEAAKSKLITGLKLSDKHPRKYQKSDRRVCDVCARANITRVSFSKLYKIRGENLGDYVSSDLQCW